MNSVDGKRQAQDAECHTETKRPRSSQSAPHHVAKNASSVNEQDASTQKSLQMLPSSNELTDSENIPPFASEQPDLHPGRVGVESSCRLDTEVQGTVRGRAAVPSSAPTLPGASGNLIRSHDSTPLPVQSSGASTPRQSTRKFPGPAGLLPQQVSMKLGIVNLQYACVLAYVS